MPRQGDGSFVLVTGNPVVTGTLIESQWANPTMADLAAGLSDSLSRSGQGNMTTTLKLVDGTMSSPSIAWVSEPTTGLYRKASQQIGFSVGAEDIFYIVKTGIVMAPGKTVLGAASLSVANTWTAAQRGAPVVLLNVAGSVAADFALANNFSYTALTPGNLLTPVNIVPGQSGIIVLTQGVVPSTLSYSTFWKFPDGQNGALTPTANVVDALSYYVVNSTTAICSMLRNFV